MGVELSASLRGQGESEIMKQNIILVGPSGVGKSSWSKAVGQIGYEVTQVDELIGENPAIGRFLEGHEGKDNAERMGNAFGKPWKDPRRYGLKEQAYLMAEREEMRKLVLKMQQGNGPHIADLTGSAIYCPEELASISQQGLVVYLSAGEAQYDVMRKNFLADPKPVCWGPVLDEWELVPADQAIEALPRLYQRLLDTRHALYLATADIMLPWEAHRERARIEDPASIFLQIKAQLDSV